MSLCRLCLSVPFTSLPPPVTPYFIGQPGHELISIRPDEEEDPNSEGTCEPIGFAFHEDLEALALSSRLCVLCAIIQAAIQKWTDALDDAVDNSHSATGESMWLHYTIPSKVRLWLTKPYGGALGFYVWTQHLNPNYQRHLSLMAAIGFSVNSGMIFIVRW